MYEFAKENKFVPNPWTLLTLRLLFLNNDLPIYLCDLVVTAEMKIHCQQLKA